jgi:hypothetical protein
MRRSTVANWFTRMHRPTSFHLVSAIGAETPELDWKDLRLETLSWSDGQILDLRLAYRGQSTGRCMVARKGIYLVEPTGPVWARQLLE